MMPIKTLTSLPQMESFNLKNYDDFRLKNNLQLGQRLDFSIMEGWGRVDGEQPLWRN